MKAINMLASALALLASTSRGDELPDAAHWIDLDTASSGSWSELSNWEESLAQKSIPTGANWRVSFPVQPNGFALKTVNLDALTVVSAPNWGYTEIGKIADNTPFSRYVVNVATVLANSGLIESYARVTIGDADDFHGYWKSSYGQTGFVLPSTPSVTRKISNVSAAKDLDLSVPTEGTMAKVGTVYEGGAVTKHGAGELEVGATSGTDTRFYVAEGTLTLNGHAQIRDEGDDIPVPAAYLHLDASKTNGWEFSKGADGRLYVEKWPDVRGNGAYAYHDRNWTSASKSNIPFMNAPFLNDDTDAAFPIVDFGTASSSAADGAIFGPSNCVLRLSNGTTKTREAFFVVSRNNNSTTTYASVMSNPQDPVMHWGGNANLFTASSDAAYAAVNPMRSGSILVNGAVGSNASAWNGYTSAGKSNLGVVSIGCTNDVLLSVIGSDRFIANRSGGFRVAEIVLYTNELTQAERLAVHRHLQRKWGVGDGVYLDGSDAGAVVLSSGTSIGVPKGRTARVTELTAVDGALVKTGAGVLEVGAFSAKDETVPKALDVKDGSVRFVGLPSADDEKPADGAYLWLDANVAASFVISNVANNATNYVAEWRDCRLEQTSVYMTLPGTSTSEARDYTPGVLGNLPFRLENAVGTLAVVDFGEWGAPDSGANSFLRLNGSYSSGNAYEGFLVQMHKTTSALGRNAIMSYGTGISLKRNGSTGLMLDTSYGSYLGRNAIWTMNGVQYNPMEYGQIALSSGTFDVYGISAQEKIPMTLVGGKDRIGQKTWFGGVQVGELILYDRKLTPEERRQTVTYLMKRWQKKVPQFAATELSLANVKFAADKPVSIDAAGDVTLAAIEGSNGSLVKDGVGTATVEPLLRDLENPLKSIAVRGGTLVVSNADVGADVDAILAKASFRIDASEATSLSFFETTNVDGTIRTNLTSVADLGSRGYPMVAWKDEYETRSMHRISYTNPVLKAVATAEGVTRNVFDFGKVSQSGTSDAAYHNPDSTGSFRFYDSKNDAYVVDSFVYEVHEIYSDAHGSTAQNVITDRGTGKESSGVGTPYFKRGSNGALVASDPMYPRVPNGDIWVDSEKAAASDVLQSGFHLLSFVPTDRVSVGSMACNMTTRAGGCQVGELIGFRAKLSDDERRLLQQHLMSKWLGAPAPAWTNSLEAVVVEEGATLKFGVADTVSAERIAGSGMIHVKGLIATDRLELKGGTPLIVDGAFVQDGALRVSVSVPRGFKSGECVLLTATSFEGLDLAMWRLEGLSSRVSWSLRKVGNSIMLTAHPAGMCIFVR